jgi:hypothetical protein
LAQNGSVYRFSHRWTSCDRLERSIRRQARRLGFSDKANLDEGRMWPTAYALKELTAVEEARIAALVKKAVS